MVTTHNQQINSTKDGLLGNTLLFSDLISKTIWVISYLVVTGLYRSAQGGLPSPSRDRDGIGRRDSFCEFSGSRKPGLGQGCARISNCPFFTRNRVAVNITNTSGCDAPFFECPLVRFKGTKTPCSPPRDCKNHAKFGRLNIALHFKYLSSSQRNPSAIV